jgi:hypothetical protein
VQMANKRYEKHAPNLVALGYDVTPVAGKKPVLVGWTDRPEQATKYSDYANNSIGVLTGGKHNLIAVDVDVLTPFASNALEELVETELGFGPKRIGKQPKFLIVFRTNEQMRKIKTPVYDIHGEDGAVEILAEGQQFVASGIHEDTKKKYFWPNDSIMDIPAHELTLVTVEQVQDFLAAANELLSTYGPVKSRTQFEGSTGKAPTLNLKEQDAPIEEIKAALAAIPNDDCHYDDWVTMAHAIKGAVGDDGQGIFFNWSESSSKYSEKETERAWKSIGDVKTIGAGSIFHMAASFGFDISEFRDQNKVTTPPPEPYDPDTNPDVDTFDIQWFSEIKPATETTDFIEDTLGTGQMSVIYGESNTGKTFFALDMAFHVATGREWRGLEVEEGLIVYCALEGSHGIRNRIDALRQHHKLLGNIPLCAITTNVDLLNPKADTNKLISTIQKAESLSDKPIKMVVLDTLSRAMAGGNENSPEDMGALVINSDKIRSVTSAHTCWIHHSGKDQAKGARGHSLLRAATDTEIEVSAKDGYSIASIRKQREFEGGQEYAFKLTGVALGENQRGKPITSCVVESVEMEIKTTGKKVNLNGTGKQGLEILRALIDKTGTTHHNTKDFPAGVKMVTEALFKQVYEDAGVAPDGRENLYYNRVIGNLQNTGKAVIHKNYVWLVSD